MTRVLFIPDENSVMMLDSALSAQALAAEVNAGSWQPPPPYANPAAEMAGGTADGGPQDRATRALHALQLEGMVIIAPFSRHAHTLGRKALREGYPTVFTGNQAAEEIARKVNERQMKVLHGLAVGMSIKQIALDLGVMPRTTRCDISSLKRRLGAHTHAELVGRAFALGLLDAEWVANEGHARPA